MSKVTIYERKNWILGYTAVHSICEFRTMIVHSSNVEPHRSHAGTYQTVLEILSLSSSVEIDLDNASSGLFFSIFFLCLPFDKGVNCSDGVKECKEIIDLVKIHILHVCI